MLEIKEKYAQESVRNDMWKQLNILMDKAQNHIFEKNDESKNFYNSPTHHFINENRFELFFPLENKYWPEKFQKHQYLSIEQMIWPNFTTYCYMMDVIAPPYIPSSLLHFGYAVLDNKLIRSTFFVIQVMVNYQK